MDIDPQAREASEANARANRAAVRVWAPEALPEARYEIVVANILAQPLIVLAPLLSSRAAPAGRIALSGVLETQAAEVADAYAGGFDMTITLEEGWALVEGSRR